MMNQYDEKVFDLKGMKDKQYFTLLKKSDKDKAKVKKSNYFFKNAQNQQACCLAIGPQNSGKTTLFENIFDKLVDKKISFLFLISSLPERELEDQIKKLGIKKENTQTFQHDQPKSNEYFQYIYETMSNHMNEYYQGEKLAQNKGQITQEIQQLQNQKQQLDRNIGQRLVANNAKQQINQKIQQLSESLKKILYYEQNKNLQNGIKFFIFVDDLIQLKPYQIPFFSLILRNYRHLGGVLFYVTAQTLTVIPRQLRDLFTHLILFQDIPQVRMETIFEQQRLPIDEKRFIEIYRKETKQDHGYIIVCTGNGIKAIQSRNKIYLFLPNITDNSDDKIIDK